MYLNKTETSGQSYEQFMIIIYKSKVVGNFLIRYVSSVVIYYFKAVIRLATVPVSVANKEMD